MFLRDPLTPALPGFVQCVSESSSEVLLFASGGDMISDMQDSELLRAYAAKGDETAFGELVRRYVDFVYTTARRRLEGESGLAEEVTQAVFLLLARKARALTEHPTLAGWLFRTTNHVAAKARRSETRRRVREREAVQMNTNDPNASDTEQILSLLDDAIETLSEADRLVVLLRFFLKKPMRGVGLALGVSEPAAKMRVNRAVDRLRDYFVHRSIGCTTGALALILTEESLRAAPQSLTARIMSNLPSVSASMVAGSGLIQFLILMSKAKAKSLLIGALAGVAVLSLGVKYFNTNPRPNRTQSDPRAAGTSEVANARSASHRSGRPDDLAGRIGTYDPTGGQNSNSAVVRLRAALAAAPKTGRSYPSEEVTQAVASFTDRRAAFEALKAAIANPNYLINDEEYYRVTPQALRAMEPLARDVPEVVPFLWGLFRTGNSGPTGFRTSNSGPTGFDGATSVCAFTTLQAIGLRTEDLPNLVERIPALSGSPAFQRFVPQAIADLISGDPQGAAASASALENLLGNLDENVRLCAACALASTRVDQDQRVAEFLSHALASSDSPFWNRCAVEALAKAGGKAAAFVPSLLELATSTKDDYLRNDTLRAVAKIQPNAADLLPEVAEVIANDAVARDLKGKLDGAGASFDDLVAALRLEQQTMTAASRLGDMGAAAASAVPALLQALSGRDEDQRERIVEAIHKIDPQFQIDLVEEQTIREAMLAARVAVDSKTTNPDGPLRLFVYDRAKFNTWWTRDEVLSFAKQLAARDADIHHAFVSKILEHDLGFRAALDGAGND